MDLETTLRKKEQGTSRGCSRPKAIFLMQQFTSVGRLSLDSGI